MGRWALLGALLLGCGSTSPEPSAPPSAGPDSEVAPPQAPGHDGASVDPAVQTLERSLRRVVVDAGHGGEDDGAHGVSGVLEKDVTLATASKVARALRARGFDVVETRKGDETVSLARRTELANAVGAGLFVSIHANSAPNTGARGIETYSMDLASDESALRLAERENRVATVLSEAGGGGVPEELLLLEELRHGANADWSRALAGDVHRALVKQTRGFYGRETIVDRGQRAGPFWVLLDCEIPSVLVEVGYLTHEQEEQRIRSAAFQEQVALAVAEGVQRWVERAEAAETARPR